MTFCTRRHQLVSSARIGQYALVANDDAGLVKVRFKLTRDEGGWPPVESEGVWAEPLGDDAYRIDNTPWFVLGIAADDVVSALAGSDGVLWATGKLRSSGRLTIRVIPRADGPMAGDLEAVLSAFRAFGVSGEGASQWSIVALDVAPDADLPAVKGLLIAGEADGRWDFEEGSIDNAWSTA